MESPNAAYFTYVCHSFTLGFLNVGAEFLPKIGDRKDTIGAFDDGVKGVFAIQISLHREKKRSIRIVSHFIGQTHGNDLGAERCQILGSLFVCVTGDSFDMELGSSFGVGQNSLYHGTALFSRSTENHNRPFRHV